MSINKVRSWLYAAAKFLGHVAAVNRAARTGSAKPILRRVGRVYAGKATGRALGKIFR